MSDRLHQQLQALQGEIGEATARARWLVERRHLWQAERAATA